MGVEDQRKKLMASGPTWGDRRSVHVAGGPPEGPNSDDNLCRCDVEVLTPIALMNYVDSPPHPVSRISTREWTFSDILNKGKRFRQVPRVVLKEASKAIIQFDRDGVPLIIEGLHEEPNWPKEEFHPDWLKTHGPKEISVRNVYSRTDKTMLLDQFIDLCRSTSTFAFPEEQERSYGKDAECPEKWAEWLRNSKVVPLSLIPDSAEDLLSSRHVETLMCYIGVGDTFTPCHKDLCASSGQNLMCYTEMDGSSFWFMTKGADAPEASKYFHELEQELDHETHVITIEQLAKAPFDVYIAEQKLGDLVLVPPRSCHQVVNYGGITIKTSWSRMTLNGLEIAYYHELPIYRRVCRPEIYRVKSTIYQTLVKRKDILLSLKRNCKQSQAVLAPKIGDKKLISTTESLLKLFDSVLLEESPSPHRRIHCLQPMTQVTASATSLASTVVDQITCDFCGADVFQSFFECLSCVNGPQGSNSLKAKHGDGFVICAGCYIEGRSCKCGNMDPIQCRPFQELLGIRNKVAVLLSAYKSHPIPMLEDKSPAFVLGLFRAACKLQELRKDIKREERICSTNVPGSRHAVPCSWVLNCKQCHRSRCFTHILMSQKLHAADALLIHASDSSHEEHHRHHGNSLQKYEEGRDDFLQTQRVGSKPDLTQQRVRIAEQYRTCKPINSAFVQAGWYDVHIQLAPVIFETNDKSEGGLQNPPASDSTPPLSPLTEIDSPLPLLDITASVVQPTTTAMFPSLKRKRTVLDFVAVPKRNYKARVSDRPVSIIPGPEPNQSQELDPDIQLISGDLSTSGKVTNNMVCELNQGVVQTDPLSPPTDRCTRNSHKSDSISKRPLISSCSEVTSMASTPFLSQGNGIKKHKSKKCQTLPSSPTTPMLFSTFTASHTTSSPQAAKRRQTRDMTSSDESENTRLHGTSVTPKSPEQASGLIQVEEESQRKSTVVRKFPRFKKNSRTTRQVPDEAYQSSSSTYPRSTPLDAFDLTHDLDSVVTESHSALVASSIDTPTEPTPSVNTINKNVPQAAQITSTGNDALDKAVKDLADAVRTISQLRHIPPPTSDTNSAFATALGTSLTNHHSQSTILPPAPGWFQEGHIPFFQPYPLSSPRQWSTYRYPQSSRYRDGRFYGVSRFEGGSSLRSPANHGHFSHSYYPNGAIIRPGPAYYNRRHDSYQEDHMRRPNDHSYPRRPWRDFSRERSPRLGFDNVQRRQNSFNNRSFVNSYSRMRRGESDPDTLQYGRPTGFAPRAGLSGVKSLSYTPRDQGADHEASIRTSNTGRNSTDGDEHSSPWHFPQAPSSSPPKSPIDCSWERSSSSPVQQSQESSSPRNMTLPLVDSENDFVERHSSPIDSANWEDYYEQEDAIIDKEVPRIEPSTKPRNIEFSSYTTLHGELFAHPRGSMIYDPIQKTHGLTN